MKIEQESNNKLFSIFQKRTGGAVNIKGLNFQFLYACYKILDELSTEKEENSIELEGIEDIGILHNKEYVQLKSSINQFDASSFWSMNVLKNYLEVYEKRTDVKFRFVHNTTIKKGHLKALETKNFKPDMLKHWADKINQLNSNIDVKDFLEKITFEKVSEEQLISQCKKLLLEKFEINSGAEEQFLFSLLHHILIWSKDRKVVKYLDLAQVIQLVKDSSSKSLTNEAIKQNWITQELFENIDNSTDNGYFDGKLAKPIHITMGLPTQRKHWETAIEKSLEEFDVTVIKSSSGQGKSTLAWQVAYSFKKLGFHVYKLNYLDDIEKVEQVFDFIDTRLKIGQLPIIVIDGLNQIVSQWGLLVERLYELPVKIIVTTREEDWYRYGMDVSKAQLDIVEIKLLQDEAKTIFTQLKSKNKLHEDVTTWEPIWEQIESKGLLIEYVYLLTHGKMIKERLEEQIKQLNQEEDSKAKIEILRLISLADILNIKIKTKKLTSYIQNEIGFKSDRDELYKTLEQEYYVQFDKKYVEGLHPVRSQHLVGILHHTVTIEESLLSLLELIENESIYDFFISAPVLLSEDEKEEFLEESAKIISQKSFSEMVQAVDGLMHYEPYIYWKENKEIFDDVYKRGFIQLFVTDTLPFVKLETIKNLSTIANNDNFSYLIEQQNKLLTYNFKNSYIVLFSKFLSSALDNRNKFESNYNSLGFLIKWLSKLELDIPNIYTFDEDFLLEIMLSKDVNETINLYNYFAIKSPKKYLEFIEINKSTLISFV